MKPTRLAALLILAAGCRPADDKVQTYTVPKTAGPAVEEAITPPTPGSPARTLGIIVPVGDERSRFVKLIGPTDRVSAVEPAFREFAKSLKVTDAPGKPLEYKLPEGWRPVTGRAMRQVTFQAGEPGKAVELYISDAFGGDVLLNVNRWRKEVNLPETDAGKLAESAKPLEGGPPGAVFVDLTGTATAGGMMRGPFQK